MKQKLKNFDFSFSYGNNLFIQNYLIGRSIRQYIIFCMEESLGHCDKKLTDTFSYPEKNCILIKY